MSRLTVAQAVEAQTILGLHAAAQTELSRARESGFTADDLGRYSDIQREIRARENAMRSRWWPTADHVTVSAIADGLTVLVWSGDDADVLTEPVEVEPVEAVEVEADPAHGHAYVCKRCGYPSPVGIGYPAPDLPAVVSAGLTSCACGWSWEPCVPCHGCELPHARIRMVGGYCCDCSHLIEGDQ